MGGDHVNALRVGHQLEEYAIERLLGHGGFGLTYLARDTNLNNLVAIKEYLPQEYAVRAANSTIVPKSQSDEGAYQWGLERFKHEARSLARFKHPNIVRAARLIEANGTAYMVMEYEHGLTLGEYLKRFGPTMEEGLILGVFVPILEGLAALHRAEFIHRDIKPGNIYLREEGGPMLIDFGAVRQAVGVHSQSLTSVVTPGYAPIEQYSSEGRQGPWTDLYAVGAAMYCCMLGRSPVDAARRSAAISDGDKDPLVSAVRIGAEKGKYSQALLESIDWAMQFRGRDRPQSAAELTQRMLQSPVRPAALVIPTLKDMDETWVGFRPDAASGGPRSQTRSSAPPSRPPSQPPSQRPSAPPSGVPSQPADGDEPTSLAPDISREPTRAAPPPRPTTDGSAEIGSAPVEWFGDTPSVPQMPPATPVTPAAKPARQAERPGTVVAQPTAARAEPPPTRSRAPALLGVLLLLAALGAGGWWWNQQRELDAQDTLLFEGAVAASSPEAYRAYLANCVRCAQRAAAERAVARLETERASAADAVAQREVAEKIAELKARFARHVLAGELSAGPEGNAQQVLDDLAIVAPDDPFVTEGRTRLAELENLAKSKRVASSNGRASKPAAAPAVAAAAKPATPPTADEESRPARGVGGRRAGAADKAMPRAKAVPDAAAPLVADAGKPAATKEPERVEPVARAEEPKPAPAKSAADERAAQLTQLMDRLAKFEIALARNELGNAGQALKELGAIAPDDALVKDAQRRYEGVQAKQAQQRAEEQRKREEAARAAELQRIADAALAAARQSVPTAAPAPAAPAPARPVVSVAGGTNMRDALPGGAQGPLLIVVPGGAFRMGDTTGTGARDEQPVRRVEVTRAFAIGRREITVAEFRTFADATAYRTDAERAGGCRIFTEDGFRQEARYTWRRLPFSQADDEPVVCVSWNDALTYTQWLARATGKPYRLPTEAEWEYAAKAGTESTYWWGNTVNSGRANCEGCGGRAKLRTLPVGTFSPNAFGLYDTAGNAFEWTCSAYAGSYAGQEQRCAAAAVTGDRVMRGGSWALPPPRIRSAFRGFAARDYASDNVGFRVLLEL